MSIENSIDRLASSIEKLADALLATAEVKLVTEGKTEKPAATRAAATKAAKSEPATESRSEGKSSAAEEKPADTQPTAEASDAATSKVLDYEADIRPAFKKLLAARGRDVGIALIRGYAGKKWVEGTKLNDVLPEDKFAEALEKINTLIEED